MTKGNRYFQIREDRSPPLSASTSRLDIEYASSRSGLESSESEWSLRGVRVTRGEQHSPQTTRLRAASKASTIGEKKSAKINPQSRSTPPAYNKEPGTSSIPLCLLIHSRSSHSIFFFTRSRYFAYNNYFEYASRLLWWTWGFSLLIGRWLVGLGISVARDRFFIRLMWCKYMDGQRMVSSLFSNPGRPSLAWQSGTPWGRSPNMRGPELRLCE